MVIRSFLIAFAMSLATLVCIDCGAVEPQRNDLGERIPSKEELISLLAVAPPLPDRSGNIGPMVPRAVSAAIGFEYDSAALSEAGKQFLNNLGAALSDEAFAEARILLEGHADAKGEAGYNKDLSQRRAEAVRQFLISVWGMSASNLSAVGKGHSDPIDPSDPFSAKNRAVVIVNTGARRD